MPLLVSLHQLKHGLRMLAANSPAAAAQHASASGSASAVVQESIALLLTFPATVHTSQLELVRALIADHRLAAVESVCEGHSARTAISLLLRVALNRTLQHAASASVLSSDTVALVDDIFGVFVRSYAREQKAAEEARRAAEELVKYRTKSHDMEDPAAAEVSAYLEQSTT